MNEKIKILLLEDNPLDAELILRKLREGGIEFEATRAVAEQEFVAGLEHFKPELILADYALPSFDGASALKLAREQRPGVPFIFVSGGIEEDVAIEALRNGATDYVFKQRLNRLVPAVLRGLKEARETAERMAMRAQLRLLNHALQVAANGIVITDSSGSIVWVNEAFEKLTGYGMAEVLGENPRFLKSGKHDGAFYAELWNTILAGKVCQHDMVNRRKDGSLYVEENVITPVRNEQGNITHFIAVKQDVTARRAAKDAIRESQERYQLLFNNMSESVFVCLLSGDGVPGAIVEVNSAACVRLGYSREELLKMTPLQFDTQTGMEAFAKVRGNFLIHGRATWEGEHRAKSGRVIPVEISAARFDFKGAPMVLSTVRDLTERRESAEHLHVASEYLHAIFQCSPLAIVVNDMTGKILKWNPAAELLFGWKEEEVLGKLPPFVSRDKHPEFEELLRRIQRHELLQSEEVRRERKDGSALDLLVSAAPLRDKQGNVAATMAIFSDITEKKNLEAQFLRAQRLESVGQLAGGIAHDLNNILAPILMGAPMLREKIYDPDARELFGAMEASALRGAGVIRQILTFARGIPQERGRVQTRYLLEEIKQFAFETFPKNIKLKCCIPSDLWQVEGDVTQLHQILMNLSVNARDAMPGGGELYLAAENILLDEGSASQIPQAQPGPYLQWVVADSGTGIPPEIIDRIFDPFFSTKASDKGTGLGLSTVQGIVRSHNGFILVDSKPGSGTRFRVYFPACMDTAAGEEQLAAVNYASPRGAGELILFVDDEAGIREIGSKALRENGYEVLTAANGDEGFEMFLRHQSRIKLVLTDVVMPVSNGLELVDRIRQAGSLVRVLVSSGQMEGEDLLALSRLGVTQFLSKPYTSHNLMVVLHEVLRD